MYSIWLPMRLYQSLLLRVNMSLRECLSCEGLSASGIIREKLLNRLPRIKGQQTQQISFCAFQSRQPDMSAAPALPTMGGRG